ncbi:MAG: DEAD/DEAH box helicase [Oligoflexia bacterium]|nr:DEAD/DEAH box helicase [Oligoflexia bacterium]
MNSETNLTEQLSDTLPLFFPQRLILQVTKDFHPLRVEITFTREHHNQYTVVTGIILDEQKRDHFVRLTLRADPLNHNKTTSVQSSCDCAFWNSKNHCIHVIALFIKHLFSKKKSADLNANTKALNNPSELIHFATPKPFTGHLLLSLNHHSFDQKTLLHANLHHKNVSGVEYWNIYFTASTQLINAQTSEIFTLSETLQDFVKKVQKHQASFRSSISDYLLIAHQAIRQASCSVVVGHGAIALDFAVATTLTSARPVIFIDREDNERKNYTKISLKVIDDGLSDLKSIPTIIKIFSFSNGLLDAFLKKSDATHLVKNLLKNIITLGSDQEPINHTFFAHTKNSILRSIDDPFNKELFDHYITHFLNEQYLFCYCDISKEFYKFDISLLKNILVTLFKFFGESFLRFSDIETQSYNCFVPTSILLGKLSQFCEALHLMGISVFYRQKAVTYWKPNLAINRDKRRQNWFDLTISMPQDEYAMLSKLLQEKYAISEELGLVIVDNKAQKILDFIKSNLPLVPTPSITTDNKQTIEISISKHRIFELFELYTYGATHILSESELALCKYLLSIETLPEYALPELTNVTPRPYQIHGYYWLKFTYENQLGACLADDMGLGKTLQTIMLIKSIYDKIDRVLIICPVSIILNWKSEIEKFSSTPAEIYHGGNRHFPENAKIVLSSYGVLRKEYEKTFKHKHFSLFVIDEAQHLKNPKSLGAKAARSITSDYRLTLTGTPVENNISEFCNIMDISLPGLWDKLHHSHLSENNYELTKKISRPFLLRRTKQQVLQELPEKLDNRTLLIFSEEEKNHYLQTLARIRHSLYESSSETKKSYGEIFKGILELRQLCLWQNLSDASRLHHKRTASTKMNHLFWNLEQLIEEGHQSIIFSQFTTYLDLIQQGVIERAWKYSRIDGTMPIKKRQSEVENFQNGENKIFLISLKAGGTGLNLTAASYIFLMDPWWNPAVEMQAIDRAHRIGQKNKLTIYRLLIKDSIEEKVLNLQEHKRQLFDQLLNSDSGSYFSGKLTKEDFEYLLQG